MLDTNFTERHLENLSDAELLSVFLPKETSEQLIAEYQTLYDLVLHSSLAELRTIAGIGKTKAEKIICIRELILRLYINRRNHLVKISTPNDIADYMRSMGHLKQEELHIIMLDTKNKIIGSRMISKGTISGSLVSPREVFNPAIKMMAANIIVTHNHPSGDPTPSDDDICVTNILTEAGKLIKINVLDHVIIGSGKYCSMKEDGYII